MFGWDCAVNFTSVIEGFKFDGVHDDDFDWVFARVHVHVKRRHSLCDTQYACVHLSMMV